METHETHTHSSTTHAYRILPNLLLAFCAFFQPIEPFLVQFFVRHSGISASNVYLKVFPIWTYAYFGFLFVFGTITSVFGERPVCRYFNSYKFIISSGIAGAVVTLLIMLLTTDLAAIQASEVSQGTFNAAIVVFSSYLYVVLPREYYQRIASYTRACNLLASVTSAVLGQLLLNFASVSLSLLALLTLIASSAAFLVSLFLPIPVSHFSHHDGKPAKLTSPLDAFCALISTYRGNATLIRWSCWSGVCLAVHQLVFTYWQSLFYDIDSTKNFNGYVYVTAYFLAALAALVPVCLERSGKGVPQRLSDIFVVVFPLADGALLFVMAEATKLWIAYVLFVAYHIAFELMSPISSYHIAAGIAQTRQHRTADSEPQRTPRQFGAVFSLNMLAAMGCQTLIQFIIGSGVLALPIRTQFCVFGGVMLALGLTMALVFAASYIYQRCNTTALPAVYSAVNSDDPPGLPNAQIKEALGEEDEEDDVIVKPQRDTIELVKQHV